MMLLVALADFGRIFSASIVIETAARDAAEIAAQEYTRIRLAIHQPLRPYRLRNASRPSLRTATRLTTTNSTSKAAKVACAEARTLPNTDYQADGTCQTWPIVRVCVHDGLDNLNNKCGHPITPDFPASVPSECTEIPAPRNVGPDRWRASPAGR